MKRCNYCGKEISYFEQYCSEECQYKANQFYEKRERFTGVFSVLCAVCVLAIGIGIFVFSFLKTAGTIAVVTSCLILALLLFFLPFPTEGMIEKQKIEKAVKQTRIISYVVLGFGIIFLIFSLFFM